MSASVAPASGLPWWKEPTKDQWYAYCAAWMGWTLDAFDFTVFLLISGHRQAHPGLCFSNHEPFAHPGHANVRASTQSAQVRKPAKTSLRSGVKKLR